MNSFACEATIYKNKAVFVFRDQINRDSWSWFTPPTPMNDQEYRWEVGVHGNANEDYLVGFSLFKYVSSLQSGNFSELIKAGQNSLFHCSNGDCKSINEAFSRESPSVSAQGKDLVVIISDTETYKLLFANKPIGVRFYSKTPYLKNTAECLSKVSYVDNDY